MNINIFHDWARLTRETISEKENSIKDTRKRLSSAYLKSDNHAIKAWELMLELELLEINELSLFLQREIESAQFADAIFNIGNNEEIQITR